MPTMDRLVGTRALAGMALFGAAFCVILLGARIYFAVSFDEPMQAQTSGWEQGPIYIIWRAVHGLEIYLDRFSFPYATAGYNWLFFVSYGAIAKGVMSLLSLPDAWIPTIARFTTLFVVLLGVIFSYLSFVTAIDARDRRFKWLCLGFAVFVMTGPLIGFGAFSTRPDIGAMVFEAAAVWLFWSSWRRHRQLPIVSVIGISVIVIVAWSFKQMDVFALGGIGLFLLYKRQFKSLFILSGINISYWAATIYLGGWKYIQNIFLVDYPMTYTVAHAEDIFINFATKSPPSLAGAAVLLILGLAIPGVRRRFRGNDPFLFAAAGLLVSMVMVIPMSMQDGASENYYYTLSYFLAFTVLAGLHSLADEPAAKWVRGSLIVGWWGLVVAVSIVLTGFRGIISVAPQQNYLMTIKQCLEPLDLPRPIFVKNDFLSLPWMLSGAEPFVLSYLYYSERSLNGDRFENGGIGGMIAKKRFATIVTMGDKVPNKIDGAALDGYSPVDYGCYGVNVLLRDSARRLE